LTSAAAGEDAFQQDLTMSHCTVRIGRPLRSYTAGAASLAACGSTLAEVLAHLDERCPGVRFRTVDEHDHIRPHMRLFVNSSEAHELSACVREGDTVHLVCMLAGD
jgi:molybdopterin synthase sulfur carrier subunit